MENGQPISSLALRGALDKAAKHGEQYRVTVWPLGTGHRQYSHVGILAELGGWKHAVVVATDGVPTDDDIKVNRVTLREAIDTLTAKVAEHAQQAAG